MPPLLELFYRLAIVLVLPTPKNFKALFAVVNGLLAAVGFGEERAFTQADWDEVRRARDAASAPKPKARPAPPAKPKPKPKRK
jgi:hypothetical protein